MLETDYFGLPFMNKGYKKNSRDEMESGNSWPSFKFSCIKFKLMEL